MRRAAKARASGLKGWRVRVTDEAGDERVVPIGVTADRRAMWAGAVALLSTGAVLVSFWHGERCVCMGVRGADVARLPEEKRASGRACTGGLTWGDEGLRDVVSVLTDAAAEEFATPNGTAMVLMRDVTERMADFPVPRILPT